MRLLFEVIQISFIKPLPKSVIGNDVFGQMSKMSQEEKSKLSEREEMILQMMSGGLTNKEIASKLHLSIETVKKHLQNSYKKLGARNRIEALRKMNML